MVVDREAVDTTPLLVVVVMITTTWMLVHLPTTSAEILPTQSFLRTTIEYPNNNDVL